MKSYWKALDVTFYSNNTEKGHISSSPDYLSSEIPLVEGENYTLGGVCIIGGNVSQHTSERSCLIAGGAWYN